MTVETMRCVDCGRVKAWRDGFPNHHEAMCWQCAWDAHVKSKHGLGWWARRKATRAAVRLVKRNAKTAADGQWSERLLTAELVKYAAPSVGGVTSREGASNE